MAMLAPNTASPRPNCRKFASTARVAAEVFPSIRVKLDSTRWITPEARSFAVKTKPS